MNAIDVAAQAIRVTNAKGAAASAEVAIMALEAAGYTVAKLQEAGAVYEVPPPHHGWRWSSMLEGVPHEAVQSHPVYRMKESE